MNSIGHALAGETGSVVSGDAERRAQLFHETPRQRLTRWALGTAYAVRPKRIAGLPGLAVISLRELLGGHRDLPDPEQALASPEGLCGVARDLTVPTLVAAYRRGLYPFCHYGPMKWWAPRERAVLDPAQTHIGKNLRRRLRKNDFTLSFDQKFEDVLVACAEPRPGRPPLTWITPRVMNAYAALYDAGHAHSFEVCVDGQLVGGGFGVALGRVFFTMSQFSRIRDGSKIGFASLNHHLAHWDYVANDGQGNKPNLEEFGFRSIPRSAFNALLVEHAHDGGKSGRWSVDLSPSETANWANDKAA
jgi:leucyl/phenylalanyl-tRNA--protein transferase